jgi:elongation factor 3
MNQDYLNEFKFPNEKKILTDDVNSLISKLNQRTVPYYFDLIPQLLDISSVGKPELKNEIEKLIDLILSTMNPNSIGMLLPYIFDSCSMLKNWKLRVKSIELLGKLADLFPLQICAYLPDIIPELTSHMNEIKKEIKTAAYNTMVSCCNVVGNSDIEHMTQHIVSAILEPEKVPELMHELAGVIFVQSVKSSALSMVVPLLLRGLNSKLNATKRQSAIIIENMSKLVDVPKEATPFLPRLLPALKNAEDSMSDPEARSVIGRALGQLERLEKKSNSQSYKLDLSQVKNEFKSSFDKNNFACLCDDILITYLCNICIGLTLLNNFETDSWAIINTLLEYDLKNADNISNIVDDIKRYSLTNVKISDDVEEDDGDEILCDCAFTLAYGTKILLHNTKMKLRRGHKYGLIGPTNAGKSTFLKSMSNGSLEGFPDPSEVKTVFVQADVLGELSHLSCIDYVMADPQLKNMDRELVLKALDALGFNDKSPAKPTSPVHTFSGGYRIKMALATAMLKNPDILLLDEPVKHLDVLNIAWVKNYICSLKNVTCIMVSKNRGFLNECCTDIINIDNLKLFQHKGNLDSFLLSNPEYTKYYEIKESEMKFSFPPVTMVEGIKSKGKALMKMTNCTFTYPTNTIPTIFNISSQVSMGSKIAVYGPNGHGKSTMIKVLTGEVVPQEGDVWTHENARVAYIAQHAFHHIEQHLDKTPKEYVQWRYSGQVDKEGIVKLSMIPTDEEKQLQLEPFEYSWKDEETGHVKRAQKIIVEVTGKRQTNRNKEYEYEVKFKDGVENWVEKKLMIKRGFEKKIKEIDLKIAQLTGLNIKSLTLVNIEKHFKETCGMDSESVSHTRISQLSDGEKNLVVFGAACWNNPHIIIADEPTNFLSGKSLIALANALKTFDGGVVVITHDEEFAKHVCTQTWSMVDGHLTISGDDSDWISKQNDKINEISKAELVTEIVDAKGNVSEIKIKKKISKRDEKIKLKEIRKKIELNIDLDSDEDEMANENNLWV